MEGLAHRGLGGAAFAQDLDAVARVRIGFDDGAGDMALGGTAGQLQVDFAAERVNPLKDGLRAIVAGTVGAGRGQRASRLENREAQRRIGDADALRAGATIGGVGQSLPRAVAPGRYVADKRFSVDGRSRPSASRWPVDASSTCNAL